MNGVENREMDMVTVLVGGLMVLAGFVGRGYVERALRARQGSEAKPSGVLRLVEHLKQMEGCTCDGGRTLSMESYYCVAHGDGFRERYPTLKSVQDALEAEAEGKRAEEAKRQAEEDAKVTPGGVPGLLKALKRESFDTGRLEVVRHWRGKVSGVELRDVLRAFSHDMNRVKAVRLLLRGVREREAAMVEIGDVFDYDTNRALVREMLQG